MGKSTTLDFSRNRTLTKSFFSNPYENDRKERFEEQTKLNTTSVSRSSYLQQIHQLNQQSKQIGKYDPCFCGSGKKYKWCCFRVNTTPETIIEPIGDNNWKKENEWYNEIELYHITSVKNSKRIEESGFLMGNKTKSGLHNLSEKGYFYTTIGFNKVIWDTITIHQLIETHRDLMNSFYSSKIKKEYVVYKINGSSLLKRGIQMKEDLNDGIGNFQKCIKFHLGDKVIPIKEIEYVGNFLTYHYDYEGICIDEEGRFLDYDGRILDKPNWNYEPHTNQVEHLNEYRRVG